MKIYRKLGYSEKLAELINSVVPHNVIAVAEIDTEINQTLLTDALKLILKKYPILSCLIKDDAFFYTKQNVKINLLKTSLPWEMHAEKMLKTQLSESGHLFQLDVLVNGSKSTLILMLQHTICDGVSIVNLMNKLLKNYEALLDKQDLPIKPIDSAKCLEEMLPTFPKEDFCINERVTAGKYNEKAYKDIATGIFSLKLNKDETKKILQYAKAKEITVGSLLVSCSLLSLNETSTFFPEDGKFGCNLMVNMRPYIQDQSLFNAPAFYSSYIHTEISVKNDHLKFLEEMDSFIKTSLKQNRHFMVIKAYKALIENKITANDLINTIRVERPTVGMSNVGLVNLQKNFKTFKITNFFFGVTSHAYSRTENTFFICSMTFNDELSFVLHHPMPVFSRERAMLLANKIKDNLLKYCAL